MFKPGIGEEQNTEIPLLMEMFLYYNVFSSTDILRPAFLHSDCLFLCVSGVQILAVLHTMHEKILKTSRRVGALVRTPTLVSYLEGT